MVDFVDPDWEDKVNFRHRVVVLARQATWAGGPVRQPYAVVVNFIPQSEIYEFGYCLKGGDKRLSQGQRTTTPSQPPPVSAPDRRF